MFQHCNFMCKNEMISNYKVRRPFFLSFSVGRSTVFFHLARPSAVKSNKVVQYALAHLFFHLTTSTVDPNPAVAQR